MTEKILTKGIGENLIQCKTKDLRGYGFGSIEPGAAETLLSHGNFGLNLKVSLPCPPF
jgi:hypothetical protein